MNGELDTEQHAGEEAGTDPCCTTVSLDLAPSAIDRDVRALSALGSETRYEVLRLLASTDEEVCACDLSPQLDVGQSTASRALTRLHDAGLVTRRKDGRWRYYSTTPLAETVLGALDGHREARS